MENDILLKDLDFTREHAPLLGALSIRTLRQFHARLGEDDGFAKYLEISEKELNDLKKRVRQEVGLYYPEDLKEKPHREVNKKGVAVKRK